MTPTSTKPEFSREVNQSLLSMLGFTGTAGPKYGNQGAAFLATQSLAKQYEHSMRRRQYGGQENFLTPALAALGNDLFTQFFNQTPTKNADNKAIMDTAATQAAKKGRQSTIMSDFASLEAPTNTQRKTLLGQ